MTDELTLTDDAARALREAENYCWRSNVAIVAAEHLLAAALLVLGATGRDDLPPAGQIEAAVLAVHGAGSEPLSDTVMFGSAARDALEATAIRLRESGGSVIDATIIARGVIESGEVNPRFYAALATTRQDLLAALA